MLGADGEITMTAEPEPEDRRPVRAALARHCVDTNDPFLYHKTTNRKVYETALADMPGYDEVILWNEKGEVTESCTGNIVVEQAGQYYTPPVSCGLLPGTYRSRLLQENRLVEWSIPATQLTDYTKIYVINSVVGWREVEFISY
jgi:para-aminobenzoate synthetase/4-amino-4-deoxychorismate lyase